MVEYKDIIEAQEYLVKNWEEDGKKVILACFHANPFNDTFGSFLNECTACGGNWGGMLLTGIRKLWPEVYESIPDDMGVFSWACLCYTLLLCGVDTTSSDK